MSLLNNSENFGILPVNKPSGKSSFHMVARLRRLLQVKKIGHTGTLDPFATGVLVLLIGREYTTLCQTLIQEQKEYIAKLKLGSSTDTFDIEGKIKNESTYVPTLQEVDEAIHSFQGEIEQLPPIFSAKKVKGKKLYQLARAGIEIEREKIKVQVDLELLNYEYPFIDLKVRCSKGTYIRSLAEDIGIKLTSFAHLTTLTRTKNGPFKLEDCLDGVHLLQEAPDISLLKTAILKKISC